MSHDDRLREILVGLMASAFSGGEDYTKPLTQAIADIKALWGDPVGWVGPEDLEDLVKGRTPTIHLWRHTGEDGRPLYTRGTDDD